MAVLTNVDAFVLFFSSKFKIGLVYIDFYRIYSKTHLSIYLSSANLSTLIQTIPLVVAEKKNKTKLL